MLILQKTAADQTAIAVNVNGKILNWNVRAIGRYQVFASFVDVAVPMNSTKQYYGTVLSEVTIYTSLVSCAQCSGMMLLGMQKYLHT